MTNNQVPALNREHTEAATPGRGRKVRYVTGLEQLAESLPPEQRERLSAVSERYAFRANDYYLRLIDWSDPHDPIRQLVIPRVEELAPGGHLDASNEQRYTVARGVQHKYSDTVLFLCNEVCGAFCRYCFRKRLFMNGNDEVSLDITAGLAYVAAHPEVTNVLLTGGDPLMLSTRRLQRIIASLWEIPHVRIVRIGSKMPAFNPFRISDDEELLDSLEHYGRGHLTFYLMAHFDHPRELTPAAAEALRRLQSVGVQMVNQCPLVRGVNDDVATLQELFRRLSHLGCPQYYLFQGRPTAGNVPYQLPLVRAARLFKEACAGVSGLARRARLVMSHETGKIEIVAVDEHRIYLRYHRAARPADQGRFMVCRRDDQALWLDELVPEALEAEAEAA